MSLDDINATQAEVDALAAHMADFTVGTIKGVPSDSLFPMVIAAIREPDGAIVHEVFCIATPFNEDADKEATMNRIGLELAAGKKVVVAAGIASEAWCAKQLRIPGLPRVEPRHDPNRREVIIVMAANLTGSAACSIQMAVTRDPGTNHIVVGERKGPHRTEPHSILDRMWNGYREGVARWVAVGFDKGAE